MHTAKTCRLELRLLGTYSAALDGVSVDRFRSAKVRALLAYLAVEWGRPHRRDALATLLWGESPEHQARRSLSQALTNLRHLLAPLDSPAEGGAGPLLTITGQAVELRRLPERVWVDLHAFDALLAAADPRHAPAGEEADAVERLAEAVALYRGPFLAGLSLPGCPEFEEWRLLHEEERHQAALLALERLVAHHLSGGRPDLVEQAARRQLALEPWNEGAHQNLMLALALGGQRAAALRQYELCRSVLAEELGAEPTAETEALWRQIREGRWTPLPEPARGPAGAAFVARERELARLDAALDLALAGQGRVVLVTGEAGSGKSALLEHFARRSAEAHRRLVAAGGRCSAFAGLGDPFLPFRDILLALCCDGGEAAAGFAAGPDHARRLRALFPAAAQALVELGPDLIGRLLPAEGLLARAAALAPPGAAWQARLAELEVRPLRPLVGEGAGHPAARGPEALFEQVTRVLQALARQHPLLLLLDDLQWADAASLSLLFHLGRRLAGHRILAVGAYRPGELGPPAGAPEGGADGDGRHPLEAIVHEFGRQWGEIRVDLDAVDGRRFVDALLDCEPNRLGEPFRAWLARHTAGHALFTVELLRMFQDRGALVRDAQGRWVEGRATRGEGLPPRVDAVIAERVDRLAPDCRRVLEAAAVEGESFSAEVVARALGVEAGPVRDLLSGRLCSGSRLVQPLGVQRPAAEGEAISRYRFAHELFREYVAAGLDAVRRTHLHAGVGAALEALCGGAESALEEQSPLLAHHAEQAGQPGRAARFRLLAGRRAAHLVAYDQAVDHLERGLALLEQVPASRDRLRLELALSLGLVMPALLRRGWHAPAAVGALERLAALAGHPELQGDPQRLEALTMLAHGATFAAEPERGRRLGEQLLALAEGGGGRQALMLAHWELGHSCWQQGQLAAARAHQEQALALSDPEDIGPLIPLMAGDPRVMARAELGATLWQLGYPDQGRAALRQAVADAEEGGDASGAAFAHVVGGIMHALLGPDIPAAREHAAALRPLGEVLGFYGAWSELLAAWSDALEARGGQAGASPSATLERCLSRAVEASSALAAHGPGVGHGSQALLLAQVCAWVGRPDLGLEAVGRARAWMQDHGTRLLEAEAWRMRGELLAESAPQDAEACFVRALDVARGLGARWQELCAALSLARLWHSPRPHRSHRSLRSLRSQERDAEARELLAGVVGWFSEGADTAVLSEARALLEELRAAGRP